MAVLAVVWLAVRMDRVASDELPIAERSIERTSVPATLALDTGPIEPTARESVEAVPADAPANDAISSTPAETPKRTVTGCVRYVDGALGAALAVRARSKGDGELANSMSELRTTSDASGEFSMELPDVALELVIEDARLFTVCPGAVKAQTGDERTALVVAPLIALAGRVTDEAGVAVANAHVGLQLRPEAFAACVDCLSGSVCWFSVSTRSDSAGEFELARVPAVRGMRLNVTADGFDYEFADAPLFDDRNLTIQLRRLALLRGRVVRSDGSPASDALVYADREPVRANASGAFEVRLRPVYRDIHLVAIEPDRCPAHLDVVLPANDVVMVLGAPSRAIAGRVEDANGNPLANWFVDVRVRRVALGGQLKSMEELVGSATSKRVTDEAGRFDITGLCEEAYDVVACSPDFAAVVVVPQVPVGTAHVQIRVTSDATVEALTGVVRTQDGRPMSGVRFTLSRLDTAPAPTAIGPEHTAVSDAEGRFLLHRVPKHHPLFDIRGESILPMFRRRLFHEEPAELQVIIVAERAAFRVEPTVVPNDAHEIGLSSRATKSLDIWVFQEGDKFQGPRQRFGVEPELLSLWRHTDAAATELVFYRDDEEIGRRAIRLSATEPTVIR
ncbi:MAG: carboxypeptidase-like regulatory domain-containing protein [Planctomycetota bacterium]